MKKISSILLAALMTVSVHAQIINGDLNHNDGLDVEDVTLLIDGYLTGDAEYISSKINFYQEDNSLIEGKWYKSKTESIEFQENGLVEGFGQGNVYEYKFLPSQGRILLFSNGAIYNSFDVVYLTDEQMIIRYIDGSYEAYTHSYPVTKVNRIEICYSSNWDPVGRLIMHVYSNGVIDDERLRALVFPEDADNKEVIWSSSDESVVTVDKGYVVAVGEGTAVITCESTDGSGVKATCPVTVTEIRWVTAVTLYPTSLTLYTDETKTVYATVTPSDATDKSVMWSSSNPSVASVSNSGVVTAKSAGTATITCKAADAGNVSATCPVTVKARIENGYEWVDLGLPSGLKWATMNVGAHSPEEYGDYFAWGETEPKSFYNYTNYKWCTSMSSLTKYNSNSSMGERDFKYELDRADDAARVNWGGRWRMPTQSELYELIRYCTWTTITQNGVQGRLVTGSNGNSIFLPDAGHKERDTVYKAGAVAYYYSSTRKDSWNVYFLLGGASNNVMDYATRFYGYTVRAVCE